MMLKWRLFCIALVLPGLCFAASFETAEAKLEELASATVGADAETRAKAVEDYQMILGHVAREVLEAERLERHATIGLLVQRDELSRLLAVMQADARSTTDHQRMHPAGALGAARALSMLEVMRPGLRAQGSVLSVSLENIASARSKQADGRAVLEKGLAALDGAQENLASLLNENGDPSASQLREILDQSADLAELSRKLPPARTVQPGVSGMMDWPIRDAQVVRGFREPDGARVRRPGASLAGGARALVRAPDSGRIRYSGPFLDYGFIVVIDADSGVRVVLAGLSAAAPIGNDRVERGALLGRIGGRSLNLEEFLTFTSGLSGAGASETLYVQVDDGKGPVDPMLWFKGENG